MGRKHEVTEELLAAVARRFRALSAPSRLRIVNALMEGPLTMADLGLASGLEPSNLSRQITELEKAGCVRRRRSGRFVEVEICDPTLQALCDLVCGALVDQAAETHAALGG
jgi:DNA-binding transcriptional ArsR family regulator